MRRIFAINNSEMEIVMRCPYCGAPLTKKKYCDGCKEDVTLYKNALRSSNIYYNLGLEQARVRDLSNAIINLNKSLKLDKNNINARNLLGLCYYETGEVVEALAQWVISKNLMPKKNELADYYIEKVQSNPTKLDNINQAVKKYNSALASARQDSEDLAIIQLKKVVNLNPKFLKAMHLLALLYIKTGEKERAHRILSRARKIDITNTTTLKYLAELGYKSESTEVGQVSFEPDKDTAIGHLSGYSEDKPNIMAFVNLIIGIIIGIAVVGFLVVPTVKNEMKEEYNNETQATNDANGQMQAQIDSLNTTNETLEKKIEKLTKELEEANKTISDSTTQKAVDYSDLFEAIAYYNAKDYEKCALKLADIDKSKYDSVPAKTLHETMAAEVFPDVVSAYYQDGRNKCNNGQYDEALAVLIPAYKMEPGNADVLYFIGRSYQKSEDYTNALKYYNILIEKAPDSNRASTAKTRIEEIKKAQAQNNQ